MPAFAQIPFDAQHLAWFLAVLFFLVAGLNQLLVLADRVRGRKTELAPQPLVVQSAAEWVARADCQNHRAVLTNRLEQVERDLEILRAQLTADRQTLLDAGEDRARRIHQRIDALGLKLTEELGILRGELKRIP